MVISVDAAGPDPCSVKDPTRLTGAVGDMQTAYTDAAGRPNPDFTELDRGLIGGKTLSPGLYKWGTSAKIATDVTLSGGPNDAWILQIAGNLIENNGIAVHFKSGASINGGLYSQAVVTLQKNTVKRPD